MAVNGVNSAQRIPLGKLVPTVGVSAWIFANLGTAGFFEVPNTQYMNRTAGTICIQALPGNAANIYILENIPVTVGATPGSNTAVPNTTTYQNVLYILAPGAAWFDNSWMINNIDPSSIYVGYSTLTDGAIGYIEYR
jgi:hypothetical protein